MWRFGYDLSKMWRFCLSPRCDLDYPWFLKQAFATSLSSLWQWVDTATAFAAFCPQRDLFFFNVAPSGKKIAKIPSLFCGEVPFKKRAVTACVKLHLETFRQRTHFFTSIQQFKHLRPLVQLTASTPRARESDEKSPPVPVILTSPSTHTWRRRGALEGGPGTMAGITGGGSVQPRCC